MGNSITFYTSSETLENFAPPNHSRLKSAAVSNTNLACKQDRRHPALQGTACSGQNLRPGGLHDAKDKNVQGVAKRHSVAAHVFGLLTRCLCDAVYQMPESQTDIRFK